MPSANRAHPLPSWLWVVLPFLLAAWLRLRGIGEPEAFVDESGNILTALDPRVRAFVDPLGQGRPLLAWLFRPSGWFPDAALPVARIMAATAGLVTMAGVGWTLGLIAGRGAALRGLWLWSVMPFAVFHERLALQDPFVAAALAWCAALLASGTLTPGRGARWRFAGGGALLGLALILKISAGFALPWLTLLCAAISLKNRRMPDWRNGLFFILGILVSLASLGPDVLGLGGRTAHFSSLPDFSVASYGTMALDRLRQWLSWYAGYGRWPLGVLFLIALTVSLRCRAWPAVGGALGAVLALIIAALLYNRPFARYILPDHIPLVLFLALGWQEAAIATGWWRRLAHGVFGVAAAGWGLSSAQIATDHRHAPVPATEIAQYFTGPWSGNGVSEVKDYLSDYATRHRVRCVVLTHRFARPGCYSLMLAALADARLGVLPFTIYDREDLAIALNAVRRIPPGPPVAFFILYEGSLYPSPAWLEQPDSRILRTKVISRPMDETFTFYRFDLE